MRREESILEVACGCGEFSNDIDARQKYAINLIPSAQPHLDKDVTYVLTPSKDVCGAVLKQVLHVLNPGGKFYILGRNMRYLYKKYWDFYDHVCHWPAKAPCSTASQSRRGSTVFLRYTMQSRLPSSEVLVRRSLALPWIWLFVEKQFLVMARNLGA
jgi:hypothetical protein